jgi:hypothetical protein
MESLEVLRSNLLSPIVLAFALGMIATFIKSDLRFPEGLYTGLSMYLLFSIGLKGGVELSDTPLREFWLPALATIALGLITPTIAYAAARKIGRLDVPNSAALAAHYGSVSAVTFIAATMLMQRLQTPYEGFMPTLVALLEIPAILVALLIASRAMKRRTLGAAMREVLAGRTILLLLGGLIIGLFSGRDGVAPVAPLFFDLFRGALTLFLLEMGMITARRLIEVRSVGPFIFGFAILAPVLFGALGVAFGLISGLSPGGSAVLGAMAASASYIAAPAAVRIALPEANPSLYLTATLGITFPFNLSVGIPLYLWLANQLAGFTV